jgi:hypothetical protein
LRGAIEAYNRQRGWTREGWLTAELLDELDLSDIGSLDAAAKADADVPWSRESMPTTMDAS